MLNSNISYNRHNNDVISLLAVSDSVSPDHDGHRESDESSRHAYCWRQGDDLKATCQ